MSSSAIAHTNPATRSYLAYDLVTTNHQDTYVDDSTVSDIDLESDSENRQQRSSIHDSVTYRTPLPARQISILMLVRFCESASIFSVFPYLQQLLASMIGGNSAHVGYYAGLLEFIRNLISIITVMYWSRVSDHIGRKPILLLGTAALGISMVCFGLSKTFWALVLSRCVYTALNSGAGTVKSSIGEMTDHTNSADAFALLHVPWAAGSSFGSLVGGWLANPQDRYPQLFSGPFWKMYPYFLPCAAIAFLCLVSFALTLTGLRETLPNASPHHPLRRGRKEINDSDSNSDRNPLLDRSGVRINDIDTNLNERNDHTQILHPRSNPVPIRDLLTFQVLIPLTNYTAIAFLHTSSNSILPLFLALPISLGGLNLTPSSIGMILGVYGASNSLFQAFCLGRMVRWLGVKRVYLLAITAFLPMFFLYGFMNVLAVEAGRTTGVVYILLFVQLGCSMVMESGYGCIYIFITAASPNKQSLGSTNGLGQTMVSIVRMVAPAFAGTLLSFSLEHQIIWGYGVYVVLFSLTIGCLALAKRLPDEA